MPVYLSVCPQLTTIKTVLVVVIKFHTVTSSWKEEFRLWVIPNIIRVKPQGVTFIPSVTAAMTRLFQRQVTDDVTRQRLNLSRHLGSYYVTLATDTLGGSFVV